RVVFKDPGGEHDDGLTLDGTQVAGGLTYVGGAQSDNVVIGGQPARLTGDVRISFGTQDKSEYSSFTHHPGSVIDGRVGVSGGPEGRDVVVLRGTIKGDVEFNLGGGTNETEVSGIFQGAAFRYAGGSGVDQINYKPSDGSARARFIARLGDGADAVTFTTTVGPLPGTPVNPKFAFIDFGAGSDSFTGVVNFDCQFLNLV
ncbi:MAG TPA: hypothetical protein VKD90_19600, partial [Gemmataceae bacterium]|nr:hypothetical protein [Gemmataceae bacterium]